MVIRESFFPDFMLILYIFLFFSPLIYYFGKVATLAMRMFTAAIHIRSSYYDIKMMEDILQGNGQL